jgi:hypothetical protein
MSTTPSGSRVAEWRRIRAIRHSVARPYVRPGSEVGRPIC